MGNKIAILQVADTGPLESLVVMLNAVGYDCYLPDSQLRDELRRIGCDTVLDIKGLVQNWGYDPPFELPPASIKLMDKCDLYVDVKAQRNGKLVCKRWPRIASRLLWYRINGGAPEHVIKENGFDCGDEANPGCPILTPNMCYKEPGPWSNSTYVAWPPFVRLNDYYGRFNRLKGCLTDVYHNPVCFIHNINGWGYASLVEPMRDIGVRVHGVNSPDDLLLHRDIPLKLSSTLAMVHMKSSDAPGYAMYECLAAACPLIVTRRMIWRCKMEELLIPDKTCLVFDRIGHQELTKQDVVECTKEVQEHLRKLQNPEYNRKIGMAGYNKLLQVLWSPTRSADVESLNKFMRKVFP